MWWQPGWQAVQFALSAGAALQPVFVTKGSAAGVALRPVFLTEGSAVGVALQPVFVTKGSAAGAALQPLFGPLLASVVRPAALVLSAAGSGFVVQPGAAVLFVVRPGAQAQAGAVAVPAAVLLPGPARGVVPFPAVAPRTVAVLLRLHDAAPRVSAAQLPVLFVVLRCGAAVPRGVAPSPAVAPRTVAVLLRLHDAAPPPGPGVVDRFEHTQASMAQSTP